MLRHAKSSWKDPSLADHDRPLSGRGKRAGMAIARHLREQGIDPKLVLCSSARRARQTLELIEPALGRQSVQVEDELYGASAAWLLERLRVVPERATTVMLIGHNPGLQELVVDLARRGPQRHEVELKFPTAALATLALGGTHWAELDPGRAELVAFVRPRDLP